MKRIMTSLSKHTQSLFVVGTDQATTAQISKNLSALPKLTAVTHISSAPSSGNAVPDQGIASSSPSVFSTDTYRSNLATTTMGRNVLYSPLLHSTQTIMQDVNTVVPPGTVCVADQQTAGRGRGSNAWFSPPGCLLFSFTFTTKDGGNLPFAQYLISLALVKAVHTMPHCGAMPIKIKWPNDIYARLGATKEHKEDEGVGAAAAAHTAEPLPSKNGTVGTNETSNNGTATSTTLYSSFVHPPAHGQYSKLGGVLCESTYDHDTKSFMVIAGIGLNVTNHAPTTCLNALYQTQSPVPQDPLSIGREAVLASFFNTFEPLLDTFNAHGFNTELTNQYTQEWLHSGQQVMVCDLNERKKRKAAQKHNKEEKAEVMTEVTIVGIAKSSGLLAVDGDGNEFELLPDGNSFDFLKGLIKRKI
jgi:biotin--protein ligase